MSGETPPYATKISAEPGFIAWASCHLPGCGESKGSGYAGPLLCRRCPVHDEARDYRGLDAIRSWQREADAKYRYVMEPLDASVSENIVTLCARLTGDFPGSPIELDYTFTLANDKITSLEIH